MGSFIRSAVQMPQAPALLTCSPSGAYRRVKRRTLAWSFCFLAASRRLRISLRSLPLASSSTCMDMQCINKKEPELCPWQASWPLHMAAEVHLHSWIFNTTFKHFFARSSCAQENKR